jgi:hypothetical protein
MLNSKFTNNIFYKIILILIFTISSCGYLKKPNNIYIERNAKGNIIKKITYKEGETESKIFDQNQRLSKKYTITYQKINKDNKIDYQILINLKEYKYYPTGNIKQITEKFSIDFKNPYFIKEKFYDKKGSLHS